jgi:transcription initiation factor IIE alpha subunit
MIYKVGGIQRNDKTVVFVCPECLVVPDQAYGAQNKEQLVHIWICPKCNQVLAEWETTEQRDAELTDLAKKVEIQAGGAV